METIKKVAKVIACILIVTSSLVSTTLGVIILRALILGKTF